MPQFITAFILLFSAPLLLAMNAPRKPMPLPDLDLVKYQGLWHQHATIPASFQNNCIGNATAEYSILPDGLVKVVNSCDEKNGKRVSREARARVNQDYGLNSTLEVTFVNFGGWIWEAAGDYWTLYISKDYDIAIVGHPTYNYGWILAKTEQLNPADYKTLNDELVSQGYDTCVFKMTDTPGMDFEDDISMCDYVKGLQ